MKRFTRNIPQPAGKEPLRKFDNSNGRYAGVATKLDDPDSNTQVVIMAPTKELLLTVLSKINDRKDWDANMFKNVTLHESQ